MQSTEYNPAYFPEGKFFLKLPGAGMNFYLNNALAIVIYLPSKIMVILP